MTKSPLLHPLKSPSALEGPLPGAFSRREKRNPLCGDVMILSIAADHGLLQARFESRSCLVCQKSMRLMLDLTIGQPLTQVLLLANRFISGSVDSQKVDYGPSQQAIDDFWQELRAFPTRMACANLPWKLMIESLIVLIDASSLKPQTFYHIQPRHRAFVNEWYQGMIQHGYDHGRYIWCEPNWGEDLQRLTPAAILRPLYYRDQPGDPFEDDGESFRSLIFDWLNKMAMAPQMMSQPLANLSSSQRQAFGFLTGVVQHFRLVILPGKAWYRDLWQQLIGDRQATALVFCESWPQGMSLDFGTNPVDRDR